MSAQKTPAKVFTGFKPGTKLDTPAPAGVYAGELTRVEMIDTEYGERYRLVYSFDFVDAEGTQQSRTVSELATTALTTGAKFIRRLCAANDLAAVPEDLDPAELEVTGPVMLKLKVDEKGYNAVEDVFAPSSMRRQSRKRNIQDTTEDGGIPGEKLADDVPF